MHVRQAANVIELLEYFARRGRPATSAEMSDDLGWPRSSTFNLVSTLADMGFLYEPGARFGYYPGPRWLALSQTIAAAEPLPDTLAALTDEVAAATGETTAIATASGTMALLLCVTESAQRLRYMARVGDRVPIHASSAGRAILAQMPLAERAALYRRIDFTRHTATTPATGDEVEAMIAAAQGFHHSLAEFIPDLAGVAVALPFAKRRLSLVVAGPVSRCLARREEFATLIHDAIRRTFGDTT